MAVVGHQSPLEIRWGTCDRKASEGKWERPQFFKELLGLPLELLGAGRHRLLHSTARGVMAAERFHAGTAWMVSQSSIATRANSENPEGATRLFSCSAQPNDVLSIDVCAGIQTHISCTRDPVSSRSLGLGGRLNHMAKCPPVQPRMGSSLTCGPCWGRADSRSGRICHWLRLSHARPISPPASKRRW
jgi:hypothetical protein